MSLVAAASGAVVFGARDDELEIAPCLYIAFDGHEETWPSRAALIFSGGFK